MHVTVYFASTDYFFLAYGHAQIDISGCHFFQIYFIPTNENLTCLKMKIVTIALMYGTIQAFLQYYTLFER